MNALGVINPLINQFSTPPVQLQLLRVTPMVGGVEAHEVTSWSLTNTPYAVLSVKTPRVAHSIIRFAPTLQL
jgi:hypothetical protein